MTIKAGQIYKYKSLNYSFLITKVTSKVVDSEFLGENGHSPLRTGDTHLWDEKTIDILTRHYIMVGYDKPHLWKQFYSQI
jgi:hypothetical protein